MTMTNGESLTSDYVIIATHADQALSLLDQPTSLEQSLLGSWTYSNNQVYLHTDSRVMPPTRNAWSSWLVQRTNDSSGSLQMSYYMNRLQSLQTSTDYFVTLNNAHSIAPDLLIKTIDYTHPVYTDTSVETQDRLPELNSERTFFAVILVGFMKMCSTAVDVSSFWSCHDTYYGVQPFGALYRLSIGLNIRCI